MQWISRAQRMPDHDRPVLLFMDAGGPVGNSAHPGYATGGKWVEIGARATHGVLGGAAGRALLDLFVPELAQTGLATHWMGIPALPGDTPVSAPVRRTDLRPAYNSELEALRRFHEFFVDKCEALFADHGWSGVELFNRAAAARRGEVVIDHEAAPARAKAGAIGTTAPDASWRPAGAAGVGDAQQATMDRDDRSRDAVFATIASERDYQDRKWGSLAEHPHEVGGWLTLMAVHLRRAQQAWAGANNDTDALDALRKVLAVGVACGEQHGLPARSRAQPVSQRMRGDGYQRTPSSE